MLDNSVHKHLALLKKRYPVLETIENEIVYGYEVMAKCYQSKGKLLIAGNGGSAADAQHISGELMKSFKNKRMLSNKIADKLIAVDPERGKVLADKLQMPLLAIPLATNPALMTAYINDVESQSVFAQQVLAYGQEGDVLLAISTSGNSENIIDAAIVAKALGMKVIGLTGEDGGKLKNIADVIVRVPEKETYMIQELHLPIYHYWCLMLEDKFFGEDIK